MPIQDHRTSTTGNCPCCGTGTRKSTGTILLPDHPAIVYFARWTPECPGSLIAFLIGLGHPDGFVSLLYRFESNSFMGACLDSHGLGRARENPSKGHSELRPIESRAHRFQVQERRSASSNPLGKRGKERIS